MRTTLKLNKNMQIIKNLLDYKLYKIFTIILDYLYLLI
jgi:hypothetical protein